MRLGDRRGFVRYDYWLAGFGVLLLLALVVPHLVPGAGDRRLRRRLSEDVTRISAAEEARHDSTGAYAPLLFVELASGDSIVYLLGDSLGWVVAVTNPAIHSPPATCGMYVGRTPAGTRDPALTIPGVVACW